MRFSTTSGAERTVTSAASKPKRHPHQLRPLDGHVPAGLSWHRLDSLQQATPPDSGSFEPRARTRPSATHDGADSKRSASAPQRQVPSLHSERLKNGRQS
jgi:hypothetical protein